MREFSEELIHDYDKVVMAGLPNAGETTLSRRCTDRFVLHLDSLLIDYGHKAVPKVACQILNKYPRYLAEGCQGARLVRFMLRGGLSLPDLFIWVGSLNPGPGSPGVYQQTVTIFHQIRPLLKPEQVMFVQGI